MNFNYYSLDILLGLGYYEAGGNMKYRVICNEVMMTPESGCSAQKALRMVCGIFQGCGTPEGELLDVKVEYLNTAGQWKLETYCKVKAINVPK
jgi:hypothetical protein